MPKTWTRSEWISAAKAEMQARIGSGLDASLTENVARNAWSHMRHLEPREAAVSYMKSLNCGPLEASRRSGRPDWPRTKG